MKAFSIASLADLERIESRPYAEFMAHASVFDAMVDAASRHPGRKALAFVQAAESPESTPQWTHKEFIVDVRRAANLFRSLSADNEPRVAMLLPAIPQAYFTL